MRSAIGFFSSSVLAGFSTCARAGQHNDTAAFVCLQRVENAEHLKRHRRFDGVALLRPVHRDPGDAVRDLDKDGRRGAWRSLR
jgi:hypothetical protein